jgi:hypothetical protein
MRLAVKDAKEERRDNNHLPMIKAFSALWQEENVQR